jgi:hypothetical protein
MCEPDSGRPVKSPGNCFEKLKLGRPLNARARIKRPHSETNLQQAAIFVHCDGKQLGCSPRAQTRGARGSSLGLKRACMP